MRLFRKCLTKLVNYKFSQTYTLHMFVTFFLKLMLLYYNKCLVKVIILKKCCLGSSQIRHTCSKGSACSQGLPGIQGLSAGSIGTLTSSSIIIESNSYLTFNTTQ